MGFLLFVGVVTFIFGILFLFSPQTIRNLNEKGNKIAVYIDEKLYSLRIGVGVSLLIISFLAFFIVFYLIRRYS